LLTDGTGLTRFLQNTVRKRLIARQIVRHSTTGLNDRTIKKINQVSTATGIKVCEFSGFFG
jgi:hypothetical protein